MTTAPDDAWDRIERFLAEHLPTLADDLRAGATANDLHALAEPTGRALPDGALVLWRRHNGQQHPTPGLFFGLQFLSTAEAADEWGRWASLLRDDPALAEGIEVAAHPEGAVRPVYASEAWVPFASDGAGNHLALDLDPRPAGTVGQVISFGADEPTRYVLAPSVGLFLDWCARTCAGGGAEVVADPNARGGASLLLRSGVSLLDALPALVGPDGLTGDPTGRAAADRPAGGSET